MVPVSASIRSRLSEDENRLRSALLEHIVATQAPAHFAAAGAALGWPAARTAEAAAGMVAKKLAVLDAEGRVQFAYPVSALPTAHRVTLADGRSLYAMCAIDALGCCFTFHQPLQVAAVCQLCSAPIAIAVRGIDEVTAQPPGVFAVHVDLDKYEDWATST
jgi:hypothetical protein